VRGGWGDFFFAKGVHTYCRIHTASWPVTNRSSFPGIKWQGQGLDGSIGITTSYGLDGRNIESRWGGGGEIFRTRPDPPWGPPSLLYSGYWVSFPRIKLLGRGVDHPPSSRADVKERVGLYHYSPFWVCVACSRVNFSFTFYQAEGDRTWPLISTQCTA